MLRDSVEAHDAEEGEVLRRETVPAGLLHYAGSHALTQTVDWRPPEPYAVLDAQHMFYTDTRPYRGEELTEQHVRTLIQASQQGHREARSKLLFANLGMVIDNAKQFRNMGLDELDLVVEGSIAFLRHVHMYDPDRGEASLATYMRYWVRQAQGSAAKHAGRRIYIPQSVQTPINQVQRARRQLLNAGTEPTPRAVAAEIGMAVEVVGDLMTMADWEKGMVSLDEPFSMDRNEPLHTILPAPDNPEREVMKRLALQGIHHQIAQLPHDQRLVVALRHGILDGQSRSEQEVAKALKTTRSKVRKLERAAYASLKPNLKPDMLQV